MIADLDAKIEASTSPFAELIQRLVEIPGVNRRIAEIIMSCGAGAHDEPIS